MLIKPPGHPYEYPDYIEQALIDFKNRTWINLTFNDIMQEFRSTFITIPTCIIKVKKGTVLFRGRINNNEKLFNHLDEISIKPKDKVKSFGRANIPGESVFYASTNEETVAREVTQWYINDKGRAQDLFSRGIMNVHWNPFVSFITISAWYVVEDLTLALLFNSDDTKRPENVQKIIAERNKPMSGYSENYHKSFNKILNFFSSEFGRLDIKQDLEYIFSAYYAYEIYQQNGYRAQKINFDGVKYASIANEYRGENIALCESSFRKKIAFLGANYCYSYNSYNRDIDNGRTAIIARIYSAIPKNDKSFEWANSEEDIDYLAYVENQYVPITFPSDGSKFKKAVVRTGG